MINYVYCSTNPEQRELAAGFCEYSFVNPVPIYDHYATGDYSKKILSELTGTVVVQWAESILPVNECASRDWIYWIDHQYLSWLAKGNRPLSVKYFANCYETKRLLKNYGKESRAIYRGGNVKPIQKKFLDFKKIRIGVFAGYMRDVPLLDIYESLKRSLIKDFELYVIGQGEYKLHDNTLLDSEIKHKCPNVVICDYAMQDMDVIIVTNIKAEAGINEGLRNGIPIVALPSVYANDMQKKYNCISVASKAEIGNGVMQALSEQVIQGRNKMSLIANEANTSSVFRINKPNPKKIGEKSQINVFGLFRNNEETIGKTLSGLKAAERKLGKKANYYFFENDSTDDTPNQIKDFYRHSSGNYECQIAKAKLHGGNSRPDRLRDLAIYRNQMKSLCNDWDSSDYTFIVDSEITFKHDILEKMINSLESYPECVMVTPYGTPEYNNEYYDMFAYLDTNDEKKSPSHSEITEANSAFAGFACIRTEVFKQCHWQPLSDISEHVFFCEMVRQYGKIIVEPSVVVRWRK